MCEGVGDGMLTGGEEILAIAARHRAQNYPPPHTHTHTHLDGKREVGSHASAAVVVEEKGETPVGELSEG